VLVEAGLICIFIFIEPSILNEARVSSYIQDILRHFSRIKYLNMISPKISFKGYNYLGALNTFTKSHDLQEVT